MMVSAGAAEWERRKQILVSFMDDLEITYTELAEEAGVPSYRRIPALGTADGFITGLGQAVERALAREPGIASDEGGRICPSEFGGCPCRS